MKQEQQIFLLFFLVGCLCMLFKDSLFLHNNFNLESVYIIESYHENAFFWVSFLILLTILFVELIPFLGFYAGTYIMQGFMLYGMKQILFILVCFLVLCPIYILSYKIKERI